MSNTSDFILLKEDHTLGNLLSEHLKQAPHVLMAGYKGIFTHYSFDIGVRGTSVLTMHSGPSQRPRGHDPCPDRWHYHPSRGHDRCVQATRSCVWAARSRVHSRVRAASYGRHRTSGERYEWSDLGYVCARVHVWCVAAASCNEQRGRSSGFTTDW